MLATATMVKSKACAPVALLASWSVRPTAIRLAILAPSRVVSAAARESSSESANREVDAESIGPIITHTQARKTSVAALQPMSTAADQGAPASHAMTNATAPTAPPTYKRRRARPWMLEASDLLISDHVREVCPGTYGPISERLAPWWRLLAICPSRKDRAMPVEASTWDPNTGKV